MRVGHPAAALSLPASAPRTTARHRSHPTRHHDVSSEPSRTGQSLQRGVPTLNTDKCEQKETGNQLNLKHNELDKLDEFLSEALTLASNAVGNECKTSIIRKISIIRCGKTKPYATSNNEINRTFHTRGDDKDECEFEECAE